MRMLLCKVMEQEGYRVVEAGSAEQCLALYKDFHPDVILLNAMMAGVDGLMCCGQLEKLSGNLPPVLMITSLDDQATVDRIFEVGAPDYISKPIRLVVMRQRVRRLLQASQVMEELRQQTARERLLKAIVLKIRQSLDLDQKLASLDGLTQVANRRHFDEYLEQEWQRMLRESMPLSLILCDIDHFKTHNDTYGHPAGDHCLQHVASTLSEVAKRPADLAARYGGEEFAMILPNTRATGALEVAEAIRSQLRVRWLVHANFQVSKSVTLSIGVASTVPRHTNNSAGLIAAADQALYQVKAQGRDRVILATFALNTPSS